MVANGGEQMEEERVTGNRFSQGGLHGFVRGDGRGRESDETRK